MPANTCTKQVAQIPVRQPNKIGELVTSSDSESFSPALTSIAVPFENSSRCRCIVFVSPVFLSGSLLGSRFKALEGPAIGLQIMLNAGLLHQFYGFVFGAEEVQITQVLLIGLSGHFVGLVSQIHAFVFLAEALINHVHGGLVFKAKGRLRSTL